MVVSKAVLFVDPHLGQRRKKIRIGSTSLPCSAELFLCFILHFPVSQSISQSISRLGGGCDRLHTDLVTS